MRQISDTTLAYWAGVFDIAGCIRWKKMSEYNRRDTPLISLTSRDKDFLTRLKDVFGGGIRVNGKWYRWERSGSGAVFMIGMLNPFFVKRKVPNDMLMWKPMKRGPHPRIDLTYHARTINRLGEW